MIRPRHLHGLGPDFENHVRLQLKLDDNWSIVASGIEEIEIKTKSEGIEIRDKKSVAYCELEASDKFKDEVAAAARCPGCSGQMCRRGYRENREWQHLPVIGLSFVIRAQMMRLQCFDCGQYSSLQAPWESPSKHFTIALDEVVIKQVIESGYSGAALMLTMAVSSLHKLTKKRVGDAHQKQDWSRVTAIGVDDYAIGEGQQYLTIFSDIRNKQVLFVALGRTHETFKEFLDAGKKHGLIPGNIVYVSMDMGTGYIKGAKLNFPKAALVFDKFHVIMMANDKVDQIRRSELGKCTALARGYLKGNAWIYRKNEVNLTAKERERFAKIDLNSFWTGKSYQARVALQAIYAIPEKELAAAKLKEWVAWVRGLCLDSPAYFSTPMQTLAKTIEMQAEGILSHWDSKLTNAFHEGMHSAYSAVKRKARGLGFDGMRTLLYLHYAKLDFGFDLDAPLHTTIKIPKTIRLTQVRKVKTSIKEIA
jgi:transposase